MSRHRYLVCYDVREQTRLRRTHSTMLGYGDPLQYSVFVCDLSGAERVLMEVSLCKVVNLLEDSIVIIDLGPAGRLAEKRIRTLGPRPLRSQERVVVV